MPYELCSIVALKVATIEGTSDESCHLQDYLLGLEERTLPGESFRQSASFEKLRSPREYACHYGGEDNKECIQ